MNDDLLEIDSFSNACDYLDQALVFFKEKNKFYLKWVTLSLSDALYNFMLAALSYGNWTNIRDIKKLKKQKYKN